MPLQSVNVCMSGESVVSFPCPCRVLMFACRGRVWSHSQDPAECGLIPRALQNVNVCMSGRMWSHSQDPAECVLIPRALQCLLSAVLIHNLILHASTLQRPGKKFLCVCVCVHVCDDMSQSKKGRYCLPLHLQLSYKSQTWQHSTPFSLFSLVCQNICYQNIAMRPSELLLSKHGHVPMYLGTRPVKMFFRLPQTWCHSAHDCGSVVVLWL